MNERFETLGNATLIVYQHGRPVLATDPWLTGTCYFGSWALDPSLTPGQIADVCAAEWIWISHGHPDHLHDQSLDLLPRNKRILLPGHYCEDIAQHLRARGFDVRVLRYREWFPISTSMRVMCLDNMNQDAILVVETANALILNLNDSSTVGETRLLRRLVHQHSREKTYLLALCSVDADMFNFIDDQGRSLVGLPNERKPGAIWAVARRAARLGVGNYCCFSSQHIYVRADSAWANPYRITWFDMRKYWSRAEIRLIEPFVTVDLTTGAVTPNYPQHQSDVTQISSLTGEDDWQEKLSPDEWGDVEKFIRQFSMVRQFIDFVSFTVGGETRQFDFDINRKMKRRKRRGVIFNAPRQSLVETLKHGYFDDLLIGNFMKVQLIETTLYPRFTPLVAKLGGGAKVFTRREYRRFLTHYLRRNPLGTLGTLADVEWNHVILPWLRKAADTTGVKGPLKFIYRTLRGDPIQ